MEPIESAHLPAKQDTLTLVGVGDMMIGSSYPDNSYLPPDDAKNSFEAVLPYLHGDVVFGNLEGCFLDRGKSTKCKDPRSTSCYAFRMPERYAAHFKEAGFNLLSIANNHINDFGTAGRMRTSALLDSLDIAHAGIYSQPYRLFLKNGVRYAFCAFSPNEHTLSILEIDSAKALVSRLKRDADIVIVSFHGGAEGSRFEHVTRKTEIFYEENRGNVYAFAHAVIDAGADVVWGHGPHVTRAVEVYKERFIAYSLGNFCTYGRFNLKGANGIAPLIRLKTDGQGRFLSAKVISVKQDPVQRLQVDPHHGAFEKIKTLTNRDFPEHSLMFSDHQEILQSNTP